MVLNNQSINKSIFLRIRYLVQHRLIYIFRIVIQNMFFFLYWTTTNCKFNDWFSVSKCSCACISKIRLSAVLSASPPSRCIRQSPGRMRGAPMHRRICIICEIIIIIISIIPLGAKAFPYARECQPTSQLTTDRPTQPATQTGPTTKRNKKNAYASRKTPECV